MSHNNTLFVGNIPYSMTKDGLYRLFEDFGTISNATISLDRETQRSRGFGYVSFEQEANAQKAVEECDGMLHEERTLKVQISRPRESRDGGDRPPRRGYSDYNRGGSSSRGRYRDDRPRYNDNDRYSDRGREERYKRPEY
ncbi:hypothetical protein HZS_7862 [Henneguya salminicola]|uniref:Putative RNA-binding protein RbpE (Trinotate prediction) n=1 Tax=Henneguya salminicola TaxID=69463 RepID=A0A6G3MKG9_HENSL|nr:hypothetical protein HZS_7862 [Henneguya salminicola]